jgi:hypothetical protein
MNRDIGIVAVLLLSLLTAAPAPAADATTVKVALTDMSSAMGMGPAGRGMMGPGMMGQGMMGYGMMGPGMMGHGMMHQPVQYQGGHHTLRCDQLVPRDVARVARRPCRESASDASLRLFESAPGQSLGRYRRASAQCITDVRPHSRARVVPADLQRPGPLRRGYGRSADGRILARLCGRAGPLLPAIVD